MAAFIDQESSSSNVISSTVNQDTKAQSQPQSSTNSQVSQPGATQNKNNAVSSHNTNDDDSKNDLAPKIDVTLSLKGTPEYNQYPFNKENKKFYFMASIKAPKFENKERTPIDLCCVVDESSSMGGDRMKLVKETLNCIVKHMESDDRLGIVGYHSRSRIVLSLTLMNENGKLDAFDKIKNLRPQGSTALCDGLVDGVNMMKKRDLNKCNLVSSIMLFTDGEANQGYKTAKDICRAIRDPEFAKKRSEDISSYNMYQNYQIPQLQQQYPQQYQQQQFPQYYQGQQGQQLQGYQNLSQIHGFSNYQQQQQVPPQLQQLSQSKKQSQKKNSNGIQYRCTVCSYANDIYNEFCHLCNAPRPSNLIVPKQSNNTNNSQSRQTQIQGQQGQVQGQPKLSNVAKKNGDDEKENEGDNGETDKESIVTSRDLPCTINTFGFGANHNASLLEKIAEDGRGMYVFIENKEMIAESFAECLGGLVSIVGKNLKVKIMPLNDCKINKCLSEGYTISTNKIENVKYYEITINDIQSEENRDLLFEINIPTLKETKNKWPIAQISCNYENVVKKNTETLSIISTLDRITGDEIGERNEKLDEQHNRLLAANAMKQADYLAKQGKLKEARAQLHTASNNINNSKSGGLMYSQNLIGDINNISQQMNNVNQYQQQGSKMLAMNYNAHYQQRAVQSQQFASQSTYSNSMQGNFMDSFSTK